MVSLLLILKIALFYKLALKQITTNMRIAKLWVPAWPTLANFSLCKLNKQAKDAPALQTTYSTYNLMNRPTTLSGILAKQPTWSCFWRTHRASVKRVGEFASPMFSPIWKVDSYDKWPFLVVETFCHGDILEFLNGVWKFVNQTLFNNGSFSVDKLSNCELLFLHIFILNKWVLYSSAFLHSKLRNM